MKWFKHISGSLSDQFIMELMDEFGDAGYVFYFGILEIMADEFDPKNPGEITLSWKIIRRKLRKNRKITEKFLSFCQDKAVFAVNIDGDKITIKCPKFIKFVDEYSQRLLRPKSGQSSEQEAEVRSKKKIKDIKAQEERFALPSKEEISEASIPMVKVMIGKMCKELYERNIFTKSNAFANKCLKANTNARTVLHTLVRVFNAKPKQAWGYALQVIKVEDGNFNESDFRKAT